MGLLLAVSCRDDDLMGGDDGHDPDVIRLSASLAGNINTRNSYIAEGDINSGTYLLLYPRPGSSSYVNHASVDFGAEEGPTTGFAYFYNAAGERKDLKWKHVYNEGATKQTFRLCNVDTNLYTIYADGHWEHLRFNKKDVVNPYVASPLDTINATNDLLYGEADGSRSTGKLMFNDMRHVMSLLKINIEVFTAQDGFQMNLDNAEVTITNISTELGAFDMRDPFLFEYNTSTSTSANTGGYQHYPSYYRNIQDVKLVDPQDPDINWATNHPGKVSEKYEDHFDNHVYETMKWIVPPQSVPTKSGYDWPYLEVRVPWEDATNSPGPQEYKIFRGRIPGVMFQYDEYGNLNSTPEFLSFKGGHQINITAQINSPETDLTFAPVTIEAWISKGSYTITTQQAGIYSKTDFKNAARLFTAGHIDQLERYGSVDNDLCSLQIWGNLFLDQDEITGCMSSVAGNTDFTERFEFVFNGYTVTLTKKDPVTGEDVKVKELDGAVGQQELYNLVTGRHVDDYKAINSPEDFLAALDFINADPVNKEDLKVYGYFNNMDNTYSLDIRSNITLNIDDIFQKLPRKVLGYDILFVEDLNKTVTVNLAPGVTLEARETDIIDKLRQVVLKAPIANGFYDNESMIFMAECYNNYAYSYPDLLKLYGTVASDGTWTFYHKASSVASYQFTVMGDYLYASMMPGGPNNNPPYKYSYTGSNSDITFEGEYITVSGGNRGISTWYNITSGQSKTTDLATTASYYNSKSTQSLFNNCGYFKDAMWHFPLDPTYTSEDFNTLFGKMIVDYENKKWDYEITWEGDFTVTGVPLENGSDETEDITLSFPEDQKVLQSITNGTYWRLINYSSPKLTKRQKR